MKRTLTRVAELFWVDDNGRRNGANPNMTGDCTGLRGDCTDLRGDCTGLRGDCTGLWGDCTGLRGSLDKCNLTDAERENGVNVNDLVCEVEE